MDIELSQLTPVGIPLKGAIRLPDESSGSADGAAASVRFPDPLDIEGRARRVGELIIVEGRIHGQVVMQCGRCLGDAVHPIDIEFESRFAPQPAASRDEPTGGHRAGATDLEGADDDDVGGIRLERDDLDIAYLPPGAHVLRVEDVVLEQVLLDLPLRATCRPDCQGLCVRCGADLNEGACACPKDDVAMDLRLAALADIRKKLDRN
jgi:uncharacterized protein